jgi:hypothetical protein
MNVAPLAQGDYCMSLLVTFKPGYSYRRPTLCDLPRDARSVAANLVLRPRNIRDRMGSFIFSLPAHRLPRSVGKPLITLSAGQPLHAESLLFARRCKFVCRSPTTYGSVVSVAYHYDTASSRLNHFTLGPTPYLTLVHPRCYALNPAPNPWMRALPF